MYVGFLVWCLSLPATSVRASGVLFASGSLGLGSGTRTPPLGESLLQVLGQKSTAP